MLIVNENVSLLKKKISLIGYVAVNSSQMDLMKAWVVKGLLHGSEHFAPNTEVEVIIMGSSW